MKAASHSALRSFFIILFASLGTLGSSAQGLAQQDLLPSMGTTWHMQALLSVPTDQLPVEPLVWSFGGLIGSTTYGTTYTVRPASQSPGNAAYPMADRAVRSVPDNGIGATHTYYDVRSDGAYELGSVGPVFSIVVDPAAIVLAYPMPDGGSVSNVFCHTSTSIGDTTDRCGTVSISHGGTGVLELPYATFQDAQLMVTRTASIDSEEMADSTLLINKDWYVPGIPYPLLHITTLIMPDGTTIRSGQVLDEGSMVGIAPLAAGAVLPVHPNPTTGTISLDVEEVGQVELRTTDGRLVLSGRAGGADARMVLDLSALPNGIYHLIFRGKASTRSARVVLAR